MRVIAVVAAVLTLAACGGSKTGPGEISGFGLIYDQRPGRSFEGLPKTALADMQTGRVVMTGPSRISAEDGTMVFDDATMTVAFRTGEVTYEADYVFPDSHPLGIIQVRQSGQLNGTRIETSPANVDGRLSGDFYGTDGTVAAGFFGQGQPGGGDLHGAYIVSNE